MKYHSCPQSKITVEKTRMKKLKNKIVLIVAAILSIFGTVSCEPNRSQDTEIATSPTRAFTINGERIFIANVEIDGVPYIATNHGGGRWAFCPIYPISK
jgi:hypothetical protein